ncbi:MAG: anthranilate synthase component I family protein [Flavobacteriales bacterium]
MIPSLDILDVQGPYAALLHSNSEDGRTLLALGAEHAVSLRSGEGAFAALKALVDRGDWVFTLLGYDLRTEVEHVPDTNPDTLQLPDLVAFVPREVWEWCGDRWCTLKGERPHPPTLQTPTPPTPSYTLHPAISRETYLEDVRLMLQHIQRGDIYEVNYCQEFVAEGVEVDPLALYLSLNLHTQAPFSALLTCPQGSLVSGSPERFLRKTGERIVSQPIKGTAPRGATPEEDQALAAALRADPKEISENVMITDLVRNDLSRVADRGSVQVDELCGIYSFRTVHQMISTVSCTARGVHPVDVIQACFPMGSMTGAPKVRAMELIDQVEHRRRGWYSGAVGYFSPDGDFDLNVVIRSLAYRPDVRTLTAGVGGAITAKALPEHEYDECLLKLRALQLAGVHA